MHALGSPGLAGDVTAVSYAGPTAAEMKVVGRTGRKRYSIRDRAASGEEGGKSWPSLADIEQSLGSAAVEMPSSSGLRRRRPSFKVGNLEGASEKRKSFWK